jgi:hypothetical protein
MLPTGSFGKALSIGETRGAENQWRLGGSVSFHSTWAKVACRTLRQAHDRFSK